MDIKKPRQNRGKEVIQKNNELPVMELRCRVPPGEFCNDQPEFAVFALGMHVRFGHSAPPHRGIHHNEGRVLTAQKESQ
ncbi:hypothetical protein XL16_13545 [Salmonella enterica subsp. enterica serovar Gaminara]|nr:hypothetical protein [Salmonella enterica subsp. enterica serovar Gaminara]